MGGCTGIPDSPEETLDRLFERAEIGDVNGLKRQLGRTKQMPRSILHVPLATAAANGHIDCLDALLSAGAEKSAVSEAVLASAASGHFKCLQALLLIEAQSGVELLDFARERNPLLLAVEGDHRACAEVLLRTLQARDPTLARAGVVIERAVELGKVWAISLVLGAGAAVTSKSICLALRICPAMERSAAVDCLLGCGRLQLKDPSDFSSANGHDGWRGWTPLHAACALQEPNAGSLVIRLLEARACADMWGRSQEGSQNRQSLPLHYAAANSGNVSCDVLRLLAAAEPSALLQRVGRLPSGLTPAELAYQHACGNTGSSLIAAEACRTLVQLTCAYVVSRRDLLLSSAPSCNMEELLAVTRQTQALAALLKVPGLASGVLGIQSASLPGSHAEGQQSSPDVSTAPSGLGRSTRSLQAADFGFDEDDAEGGARSEELPAESLVVSPRAHRQLAAQVLKPLVAMLKASTAECEARLMDQGRIELEAASFATLHPVVDLGKEDHVLGRADGLEAMFAFIGPALARDWEVLAVFVGAYQAQGDSEEQEAHEEVRQSAKVLEQAVLRRLDWAAAQPSSQDGRAVRYSLCIACNAAATGTPSGLASSDVHGAFRGLHRAVLESPALSFLTSMYASEKLLPEDFNLNRLITEISCHQSSVVLAGGDFLFRRHASPGSDDFAAVEGLLESTFVSVYTKDRGSDAMPVRLGLRRLCRIFHCGIWQEYAQHRKLLAAQVPKLPAGWTEPLRTDISKELGAFFVSTDEDDTVAQANEHWLWHGTTSAGADGIAEGDFRIDFSGSNAGTLFGNGIYLAEASSKSDEYTMPDGMDGLRTLLLCKASLGRVLYVDEHNPDTDRLVAACRPGAGFHSVLGDRAKIRGTYREFVAYDENQVYPAFICEYERIF
ncbi:unnamed protein product [Polarella glacialis]|uniref:Poly [ADP-ribose] polymerase n=1 Tax=Polarella glacialis TaxID=89957 RepID=A0A813JFY1_POLGL|nr:unnamed protein product [Polarella glacialis]